MTAQDANTIWFRAYTPSGVQVGITLGFEDGKLPSATEIDAKIAEAGYLISLPGTEPGEDVETMTHVIRCTQHNSDGTTTPCIGLYYENTNLEFARKAYLDTPEQQATFEAVSGLKIAKLPEFPTSTLPKRSDKSAARFIVKAATPFKVVMKPHHYTDDDGNEKTTKKFDRFLDAPTEAAPGNVTELPPQAPQAQNGTQDIGVDSVQWQNQIKALVQPLYVGSDGKLNPFHMDGSIKKALEEGVIGTHLTAYVAAAYLLVHRAEADYGLDTEAVQSILGGKVSDTVQNSKDSFASAWSVIRGFVAKQAKEVS